MLDQAEKSHKPSTFEIVGGIIGVILVIVAIIFIVKKMKKK